VGRLVAAAAAALAAGQGLDAAETDQKSRSPAPSTPGLHDPDAIAAHHRGGTQMIDAPQAGTVVGIEDYRWPDYLGAAVDSDWLTPCHDCRRHGLNGRSGRHGAGIPGWCVHKLSA
jgi:hypothetical protein